MIDTSRITFEDLPEAVTLILSEMNTIKTLLSTIKQPIKQERKPIGIEEAEKIIKKSKHTIYKLVSKKKIPCYKAGRKIYFFEDELIDWILGGKLETYSATIAEVRASINKNTRKRK